MTPKQMLQKAGFEMTSNVYGTITPEPYNVGKDHFTPNQRNVFIGETFNHHFYVTSHIYGAMRGYRCRNTEHGVKIGNIFGMGKTAIEATKDFIKNFQAKNYNIRA